MKNEANSKCSYRDIRMYSQKFHHSHQKLFIGSYYHDQLILFSCVNLLFNFEIMLKRKQTFYSTPILLYIKCKYIN